VLLAKARLTRRARWCLDLPNELLHGHRPATADLHRNMRAASEVPADRDDAVVSLDAKSLRRDYRLPGGSRAADDKADRGDDREYRRNDERSQRRAAAPAPPS
jgi:hypothetical protein